MEPSNTCGILGRFSSAMRAGVERKAYAGREESFIAC